MDLYKQTAVILALALMTTILYVVINEVFFLWLSLVLGIFAIITLWTFLYYVAKSLDELQIKQS